MHAGGKGGRVMWREGRTHSLLATERAGEGGKLVRLMKVYIIVI